jgi:glutamate formiminotransferase / formiminotetrahydrofolate cyclodeaminase
MNHQIIECVPNFSEGRNMDIIRQITAEIETVEGVRLLNVDPGKATNRTVVTFAGSPDAVIEAAFRAVRKATELIDMSSHKGEHPRFGATDVLPLIPIANISMDEVVEYARKLGKRIGDELGIPVFGYEFAASAPHRRNLASVRAGEYEGLKEKLTRAEWKPDFGPAEFLPHTGAIALGARDFLIAYNVNLNSTSTRRANAIAFDVRERGRPLREGNPITGKIVKDAQGNPVMVPGSLKHVKAIGWFIEEYGIAQISINLTNMRATPLHVVFDEVCKKAEARGIRVTGSEIVGLVPLEAMLEAGRYFLKKQQRSVGVPDNELIRIAVKSLGLDNLYTFKPEEKIIELKMAHTGSQKLVTYSVSDFAFETSAESPAPGGGSIAALMGTLGVSLGMMVANLSAHKRGWDDRWEEFSNYAEQGKKWQNELLALIDADTEAFNRIMDAFGLPKKNENDALIRKQAIQQATRHAIEIPLRVMTICNEAFSLVRTMAEKGNPNSVSDAGVGALALRSAVLGAGLNVKINAAGLDDKTLTSQFLSEASRIEMMAVKQEKEILEIVNGKIG